MARAATVKKEKETPRLAVKKVETNRLLGKNEPPSFRVENAEGAGAGFIICDHASPRLPKALQKNFGVSKKDLLSHIGWDLGAEEISRRVSKKLNMPLITAEYSRLVVDLNRAPTYHECMPKESFDIPVPANMKMTVREKQQRLDEIFWPYQNRVGAEVERFFNEGRVPFILALHSFTPEVEGFKRPWHLGVLWNKEAKIAKTFVKTVNALYPQYTVGENEPYSLKDERFEGSTIWRHAETRGVPYIFIEFRQDLIDTPRKVAKWADIFITCLQPLLNDKATFRLRKPK